MVLSEGVVTVQPILFEKYQVNSVVYESDTVTIYKVEHIHMLTERIIKKILKNSIRQSSFFSEINILKTIRHPGIPIIYDIEEDSSAYYIIEEYIEGLNLSHYLKKNGVLSQEEAVNIGIKICEIVSFLHGQKPVPILFLDIHPENILIKDDKIYLVDFGSSYYLGEADKRKLLMGTVGYAAPEQYRYDKLDQRTDIYGIGAVLYYMVTGRSCGHDSTKSLEFPNYITGKYKVIILQCLSRDMSERFSSVDMVARNLGEIIKKDDAYNDEKKSLIISVVGTQKRVGATYISLALATYLSEEWGATVYEEINESNHIRMLAKHCGLRYYNGYFYYKKLMLKPQYGPQVQLETDSRYIVRDYGVADISQVADSDMIIVVAGVNQWEIDNSAEVCRQWLDKECQPKTEQKVIILANMANTDNMRTLWKMTENVGMHMPYINNVFNSDEKIKEVFYQLMKAVKRDNSGGGNHKKKTRLFGRTAKKAENSHNRNNGDS